ncbi:MAG TPA: hypothetical protein VN253_18600 [Kofleriaceae bacterium]|nr:hypothetical protein [Kofleriaceae bacterium]
MTIATTRNLLVGTAIGLLGSAAPLAAQPAPELGPGGHDDSTSPSAPVPAAGGDRPSPSVRVPTDDEGKPWSRGVSIEDRRAARELFLEGNRRFRIPLFARAAEKYMAALSKWKHPAFYFNLAFAQLNAGQEVEARESLERALQYGEEPLGHEEFHEAQRQLQELEHQLGWVRVTCQTPGVEVALDGVPLFIGPGSYRGWARATVHVITGQKPGYLSEARRVSVAARKLQEVELKLLTLSEAADASRRWSVWKPWVVVAAGGAIVAASGVLHAGAFKNFDVYDEQFQRLECGTDPGEHPGCTREEVPPALSARLQRARRQQEIAVGGYLAGGSLLVAGAVLLYVNRPRLWEQEARSSSRGMAVSPVASSDMFGLQVSLGY